MFICGCNFGGWGGGRGGTLLCLQGAWKIRIDTLMEISVKTTDPISYRIVLRNARVRTLAKASYASEHSRSLEWVMLEMRLPVKVLRVCWGVCLQFPQLSVDYRRMLNT